MTYQEYLQWLQQNAQLAKDGRYKEAVEAYYQLILSDISDLDKADVSAILAALYDRMGNTTEAINWFEKGVAYEENHARYTVLEKKAEYFSELGRRSDAVKIYETLLKQPFITEAEKERLRKTVQIVLGKSVSGWQ